MPLTIYKSSAGSGKTFTLVKEYLKIVLKQPAEYKHILAITFTNKATEEMKIRIVEELTALAEGDDSDMGKAIAEETQLSREDITKNARNTLTRILHNYAHFEVRTIDSFFTRVIRSFAKELNLPMRYSIDLDQDKALSEALLFFYKTLQKNQEVREWMKHFTEKKIADDKGWNTEMSIKDVGKVLFSEDYFYLKNQPQQMTLGELSKEVKNMRKQCFLFEKKLKDWAKEAQAIIKKNKLVAKDLKTGTFTVFTNALIKKYDFNSTTLKLYNDEINWYTQKSTKVAEIEMVAPALSKLLKQSVDQIENEGRLYFSYKNILENIYSYGLLQELAGALKKYRDESNILLMSDTSALIRETIKDEDAPFLLEKVGNNFKYIFIDEFQDTSNFQWHNLRPLVKNALSENHQVLLVGDIKQSLYRWRGGNMKLLLHQVEQELSMWSTVTEVKTLNNNYRSLENIVTFNNLFFEKSKAILAADKDDISLLNESYESVFQTPQKGAGGYVNVQFFNKTKEEDGSDKSADEYIQSETVAIVENAKRDGYSFGEMMVLVRDAGSATKIANVFAQENIPFITEQSLMLKNADVVGLITSLLYYVLDEYNPLHRATLLYRYHRFFDLPIGDINLLFMEELGSDPTDFDELLPEPFISNLHQIRRKPVIEIVEDLVVLFELNKTTNPFLRKFQDLTLDQANAGVYSLGDFLKWWEESKDNVRKTSLNTSSLQNAVQIMTVHKAKGLEKAVVIVPFVKYQFAPKGNLWANDLGEDFQRFGILPLNIKLEMLKSTFAHIYEQEAREKLIDEFNVAYVAFTRPKERLYVLANAPSKTKKEIKYFSDLLYRFVQLPDEEIAACYNAETTVFEMGEAVPKKQEQTEEKKNVKTISPDYKSQPYNDRLTIRPQTDRYFEILDLEKMGKISTGIKMHAVLERLEHKDALDEVVANLIKDRVLSEDDRAPIINQISELLKIDRFSEFFDETWKNDVEYRERSIWSGGFKYKPDRVLFKGQEAIVIDYKKEIRDEKYLKQIIQYGRILQMLGYSSIRLYLVYVQTGVIDEVILKGEEQKVNRYEEESLQFVSEADELLEEMGIDAEL